MINKHPALLVFLAFLCIMEQVPCYAQTWIKSNALSMHGQAKLPDEFKYFDYVNPDAPKGGQLRLNIVGTFDSLNPYIVKGKPAEGMTYVYESLMARSQDEPFTLYPLIAEKISVLDDRSAIEFFINAKARWQDGQPLTAQDVLFSWQTLRDKGRPNHRSYYKKVARAELTKNNSIIFYFKKNDDGSIDQEMPLIMGLMPVIPQHIWQNKAYDQTSLKIPIGSGPYKISNIDVGKSTSFSRDKNYWGKDLPTRRGLFNFDLIRYDYYREENIAQEAFTAHQVDARRETDPKRWAELQRMSGDKNNFRTISFAHQRPEPARGFIINSRLEKFKDVRIRQALLYAFDFEWINRTLYRGVYKWVNSYFPNSELAATGAPSDAELELLTPFKKGLPAEVFNEPKLPQTGGGTQLRANLRIATDLFATAGYTVKDGIMRGHDGAPFTFSILLSDPQDEKIALEYARALERIGIIITIRTVDAAQFQSRLNDFDFDLILSRWINSLSPGNEQAVYWGSAAADIKGSRNYAGVKNKMVDALVQKITSAKTRAELVTATRALDRVLLASTYMIPLFYRGADLFAIWPNVMTPEKTPLYGPVVESWWSNEAHPKP
jgi:microcin C transport system substrate-binding protein